MKNFWNRIIGLNGNSGRKNGAIKNRSLRMEQLEERQLLAVTAGMPVPAALDAAELTVADAGDISIRGIDVPAVDVKAAVGAVMQSVATDSISKVVDVKLELPESLARNENDVIKLTYKNTGTKDIAAPLLILSVKGEEGQEGGLLSLDGSLSEREYQTTSAPEGYQTSLQFLASGETAGVLKAGEEISIDVNWGGWLSTVQVSESYNFDVSIIGTDKTDEMDLTEWYTTMRPESLSDAQWDLVWNRFTSLLGTTWGDYVRMLDGISSQLSNVGSNVKDARTLLSVALLWACDAYNPYGELTSSVDNAVSSSAFTLGFSRSYWGETLDLREYESDLGIGWDHNWNYSLSLYDSGNVYVNGPFGSLRMFQPGQLPSNEMKYLAVSATETGVLKRNEDRSFTLTEMDNTVYRFTADGLLSSVTDANGNTVKVTQTSGRISRVEDSQGNWLAFDYNAQGKIARVSDSNENTSVYTYDKIGKHLLSVAWSDGRSISYQYNADNTMSSVTYADGTHQYFQYENGFLTGSHFDNNTGGTSYVLGTTPETILSYQVYQGTELQATVYLNEFSIAASIEDAEGRTRDFSYDSEGRLAGLNDGEASVQVAYDGSGNVSSVTDGNGGTIGFQYDGNNWLTQLTDAAGNTTTFGYDDVGNQTSEGRADGTASYWSYNSDGTISEYTDRAGDSMQFSYDVKGNVTETYYSTENASVLYEYDQYGNLTQITDLNGDVTKFTYDANYSLIKVEYANGRSLEYTYDVYGRQTSISSGTDYRVNYTYDEYGYLDKVLDGARGDALLTDYDYDTNGYLVKETRGNGTYTVYGYSTVGYLTEKSTYSAEGTALSSFLYTYDMAGQVAEMTTLDGTWTYGYDLAGQLTSAVFAAAAGSHLADQSYAYTYDAAGNRITAEINGVVSNYTYNAMNQLLSDGEAEYTYDANGNMTSKTVIATGEVWTYTWNQDGEMISASSSTGEQYIYEYDALGNKTAVVHTDAEGNETRTEYLIDPTGYGDIAAEYDSEGNLVATYAYGYGLTSKSDVSGGAAYYAYDMLGSTAVVTGDDGAVLNEYVYDPCGRSLYKTEVLDNVFQFVGEYGVATNQCDELISMRARWYDSSVGRFVSEDPLGLNADDANLYRYCGNDFTISVDASGEIAWVPVLAGAGAVVGAGLGLWHGLKNGKEGWALAGEVILAAGAGAIIGAGAGLLAAGASGGSAAAGSAAAGTTETLTANGLRAAMQSAGNTVRATANQMAKAGNQVLGKKFDTGATYGWKNAFEKISQIGKNAIKPTSPTAAAGASQTANFGGLTGASRIGNFGRIGPLSMTALGVGTGMMSAADASAETIRMEKIQRLLTRVKLGLTLSTDTSGSMWNDIENAKSNAYELVDAIQNVPGSTVTVMRFCDTSQTLVYQSTNRPKIISGINMWDTDYGDGSTENTYSMLLSAMHQQNYKTNVLNVIVFMTDEPGDDQYLRSTVCNVSDATYTVLYCIYSEEGVYRSALPKEVSFAAPQSTASSYDYYSSYEGLQSLCELSGGKLFLYSSAEDTTQKLLDAISDASRFTINGICIYDVVGNVISVKENFDESDSVTEYHWDFDSDGIFDLTTETAEVQNVWNTASSNRVRVEAVYTDGSSKVDSVCVDISDRFGQVSTTLNEDGTVKDLIVYGWCGDDVISVTRGSAEGSVAVCVDPVTGETFKYEITGDIIIKAYDGENVITVDDGLAGRVYLYGGAGNDSLFYNASASSEGKAFELADGILATADGELLYEGVDSVTVMGTSASDTFAVQASGKVQYDIVSGLIDGAADTLQISVAGSAVGSFEYTDPGQTAGEWVCAEGDSFQPVSFAGFSEGTLTQAVKLDTPSLTATFAGKSIKVDWTESANASGYLLEASTSEDFSDYTAQFYTTETSIDFTEMGQFSSYYFRVKALGDGEYVNSDWSDVVKSEIPEVVNVPVFNLADFDYGAFMLDASTDGNYTATLLGQEKDGSWTELQSWNYIGADAKATVIGQDKVAENLTISAEAMSLLGEIVFDGGLTSSRDTVTVLGSENDDTFTLGSENVKVEVPVITENPYEKYLESARERYGEDSPIYLKIKEVCDKNFEAMSKVTISKKVLNNFINLEGGASVTTLGTKKIAVDASDGDDTIVVGSLLSEYTLSGGEGSDTLDFSAMPKVVIDLNATYKQAAVPGQVGTVRLNKDIENVVGTAGSDTIYGLATGSTIAGNGGTDVVILSGGTNNVTLSGKGQVVTARGIGEYNVQIENGNYALVNAAAVLKGSTVNVAAVGTGITVNAGLSDLNAEIAGSNATVNATAAQSVNAALVGHYAHVYTGQGADAVSVIGNNAVVKTGLGNDRVILAGSSSYVYAGAGDDLIILADGENGVSTKNYIYAEAGNDVVYAALSSGDNFFYAAAGNDIVVGGAGNDRIYGIAGNNILVGLNGADRLYGGTGRDVLLASRSSNLADLEDKGIDEVSSLLTDLYDSWVVDQDMEATLDILGAESLADQEKDWLYRTGGKQNLFFANLLDDGDYEDALIRKPFSDTLIDG